MGRLRIRAKEKAKAKGKAKDKDKDYLLYRAAWRGALGVEIVQESECRGVTKRDTQINSSPVPYRPHLVGLCVAADGGQAWAGCRETESELEMEMEKETGKTGVAGLAGIGKGKGNGKSYCQKAKVRKQLSGDEVRN